MSRTERRSARARRRRWIVAASAVLLGLAVVVAVLVRRPSDDTSSVTLADREPAPVTTTATASIAGTLPPESTPPATEPAPLPGPPYGVDVATTTVEDPSRPTAARGPTPASGSRVLPVTVYVPQTSARSPLVVFAHGYDIAAVDYAALARGLASQGFVVVAPDFPLSSTAFPGPPTQADIDEQARDVAFIVDAFLDDRVPGAWSGHVASGEAGVVGHSDGGNTVARAASNSCCFTPRIGATVALAGDEGTSGGDWGVAGSPPMLFVQGTADTVNPWSFSQRLYDDAAPPKTIVAVDGGDHLAPFVTGPDRVVALVAAFLRGYLADDATARASIVDLANRDGLRLVASS